MSRRDGLQEHRRRPADFPRVLLQFLLAAAMSWAPARDVATPDDRLPNFIIVLTDDQGYGDLGCFGSQKIDTPHIDRMAAEGMRFTHFYAQAVCGPSRAALLTGCYPIRVAEPENRKHQHTIPHPREITLAEVLKARGYATACIGKWHLGRRMDDGWDAATMPNGQGFDYFYGTPLYNGFTVRVADTKFRSPLLRDGEVVKKEIRSWDWITAEYTREAIDYIKEHRDRPFFLYLAHNMPHIPLGASERFEGKSAYGPYGDTIEEIDASTGQILEILRELNLDTRTLVVFTSDNGPWIEMTRGGDPQGRPFIPRDHSGSADPLRGYKMLTWEGGLRVPCVMWWPGRIPAGRTCEEVAATIDLLPTLAKLSGASVPDDRKLDGHDITPLMFGADAAASPHDATGFFYYRYTALEAVRSGRWKLVLPRPDHAPWTGWSGRFVDQGVAAPQLFDLRADPGEARDVAASHPELVSRLQELVKSAREDLGDYDRLGSGARFFDPGKKRPGLWRVKGTGKAARDSVVYDDVEPVGKLRFTFESGDLSGWRVIEGRFDRVVTDRARLPHHAQPFNKEGRYFLFTGHRRDRARGDDSFRGVLQSPVFEITGERLSFLVGGGSSDQTYVALCTVDGDELLKASGTNSPVLRRIHWNVSAHRGKRLVLRIVDRRKSGWGHVTFDDFSCEGELAK